MKPILLSIAACSLLAAFAAAQPQLRYTVIDLGTLGGTYSVPLGINTAGEVAGAAATPVQTDGFAATAFLWTKQKGMANLGVLGPPAFPVCPTCNSGAAGVGASGEVAMGSEIAMLGSEWRRFWSVGSAGTHSPRDPCGHLEEWCDDGASEPAGRQQRQCFLDQQSGTGQRGCGD